MKKNRKLFIATSSFSSISKRIEEKFKEKKIIIKLNPLKKKLNKMNLIKFAKDADYIIAGTEIYDKEVIGKLSNLKHIFRLGSGTDNIDINFLKKKKINFKKSKITPEISVAELIIGYIIILLRKINEMDKNLKNKIWKKEMGSLLYGKTAGIIGYGKIGKHLHRLLKSFGAKILINDIKFLKYNTELDLLLKNSDIVSININLKNSKKILDKSKLKLLKKNCILINTSRPEVIDYNYLYKILLKKNILGAGLDVFNKEPYLGKITTLNNVILTPHIGGYSQEIRLKMEIEALNSIDKFTK